MYLKQLKFIEIKTRNKNILLPLVTAGKVKNVIKTRKHQKLNLDFLNDVHVAWSYAIFKDEITNFGKEIIWNNTNIKSNTKPFMFYNWLERGITFIEHIYDYRNKRFYSFNEVQALYNVPQTDF